MRFSQIEIKHLLISVLALALIFSRFDLEMLPVMIFVIVFVFASHEILGHKLAAQHYGFDAEYRMWNMGIFLGLVMAILPGSFIFAAPGAVHISPFSRKKFAFTVSSISKKQLGIIGASGPVVNIIIGVLMLVLMFFFPLGILGLTARISFLLALFNMLPFGPLDGKKVMNWSWKVWALILGAALIGYAI